MLTNGQEKAFKLIKQWIDAKGLLFKLGGPAGSGKSFLIPLIAEMVGVDNCVLITPTGKAANNLQKAGMEASTIHSLIYRVLDAGDDDDDDEDFETRTSPQKSKMKQEKSSEPVFLLKPPDTFESSEIKLFIVDEASMVGGNLLSDIMTFGIPVLLVGDPNQLTPVNDASVYSNCDFYLDEIVRQAKDSPIIWLSQQALNSMIRPGVYGTCMVRQGPISDSELSFADMVLADTNNNRNNLNERIRELHFGFIPESWCTLNEKMICRTNCIDNRSSDGFMLTNGTLGTVNEIKHQNQLKTRVEFISPDLGTFNSDITQTPWLFKRKIEPVPPLFELGYCLTVHLSQGSEWDNLIYDMGNRPNRRSLYTAITRAKQSLLISI